jgi:DNA-3-methyladenine glycosylase I
MEGRQRIFGLALRQVDGRRGHAARPQAADERGHAGRRAAGAVSEIAAKAHRDSVARAGYRGGVIEPRPRCAWAGADRPDPDVLMVAYHDDEWGRPCHDDTELFERLALESFQAGLSWSTILRKRNAFRAAFRGFDPRLVAAFDADDRERLMADAGIVRNGAKIDATVGNAVALLATAAEFGSFDAYLAERVPPPPARLPSDAIAGSIPGSTPASDALSVDLKRRGFKFVGSTIVYAFMQSVGLVDDHLPECFLYQG